VAATEPAFRRSCRKSCGQRLAELVHVSDRIALIHALDTLRQGADAASASVRVQGLYSASEGRQFLHLGLELTALRQPDGELSAIFAQLRDISADEALRREAAERVSEAHSAHEAKSRFLAAVSHELRTPLNAILGFSDVLAGEYFGRLENDRQKEYVGLIRQSGAHLLSLVNTMLDMSKIEAGHYELLAEPFGVADVVESCRAMLDLQARGKGVTLTARTAKGLGDVVADRRAVKQILINLAGNAIKFTGDGGSSPSMRRSRAATSSSPSATQASAFPPKNWSSSAGPSCRSRMALRANTRERGLGSRW
jgi:cell cycle sensor histidine kinase DivJ